MPDPLSLASDLLLNTVGNATATVSTNVSDSIVNTAVTSVTGVEKCIYQSTFVSVIDNNKYGIVSSSMAGLNSVSCICQNEDKTSTNEKAIKVADFTKNPIPGLSSDKYICLIPPK
jgi:hypothetical protein